MNKFWKRILKVATPLALCLAMITSLSACTPSKGPSDKPVDDPSIIEPVNPVDPVDPVEPVDPIDPVDPVDPEVKNKYADVVAKIEEQMKNVMEEEVDVKLIDISEEGKLVWWGYNKNGEFSKYMLGTELKGTTNEEIIQTLVESTRLSRYGKLDTYTADKTYTTSETEITDATKLANNNLIESLTKKLVGDGYEIIAGGL